MTHVIKTGMGMLVVFVLVSATMVFSASFGADANGPGCQDYAMPGGETAELCDGPYVIGYDGTVVVSNGEPVQAAVDYEGRIFAEVRPNAAASDGVGCTLGGSRQECATPLAPDHTTNAAGVSDCFRADDPRARGVNPTCVFPLDPSHIIDDLPPRLGLASGNGCWIYVLPNNDAIELCGDYVTGYDGKLVLDNGEPIPVAVDYPGRVYALLQTPPIAPDHVTDAAGVSTCSLFGMNNCVFPLRPDHQFGQFLAEV